MSSKFLSIEKVASLLDVHQITVVRWIKSGLIRAISLPGRYVITQEDLDLFLQSRATK